MNNKSRWVIELDYYADLEENAAETLADQVNQEIAVFNGLFQRFEYDDKVCLICDDPDDVMALKFQIPESVIRIERVAAIAA